MANLDVLADALLVLGGFVLGWVAGRCAPDGIEYRAWLKLTRKIAKARRRVA